MRESSRVTTMRVTRTCDYEVPFQNFADCREICGDRIAVCIDAGGRPPQYYSQTTRITSHESQIVNTRIVWRQFNMSESINVLRGGYLDALMFRDSM